MKKSNTLSRTIQCLFTRTNAQNQRINTTPSHHPNPLPYLCTCKSQKFFPSPSPHPEAPQHRTILVVVIAVVCSTPLMTMHKCALSITTATSVLNGAVRPSWSWTAVDGVQRSRPVFFKSCPAPHGQRPFPPPSPATSHAKMSYLAGPAVLHNDGRPEVSRTGVDRILPSRPVQGSWKSPRGALRGPRTVANTDRDS